MSALGKVVRQEEARIRGVHTADNTHQEGSSLSPMPANKAEARLAQRNVQRNVKLIVQTEEKKKRFIRFVLSLCQVLFVLFLSISCIFYSLLCTFFCFGCC